MWYKKRIGNFYTYPEKLYAFKTYELCCAWWSQSSTPESRKDCKAYSIRSDVPFAVLEESEQTELSVFLKVLTVSGVIGWVKVTNAHGLVSYNFTETNK